MIINDYDLAKDEDFEKFSIQIQEEFLKFRIENHDMPLLDCLLEFSRKKDIDEDVIGECIKSNKIITSLLEKSINTEKFSHVDYSDW